MVARIPFAFLLFALAAGCGDDDDDTGSGDGDADADADADAGQDAAPACAEPVIPAGPGSLMLGVEGAPATVFGAEGSPDFATAFSDMAALGLDLFIPSAPFDEAFYAPACAEGTNPYEGASGVLRIGLPAERLLSEAEWNVPLVPGDLAARLQTIVDDCMGGDESVLGAVAVYDQPAARAALLESDADPDNDLLAANVPAAAEAIRTVTAAPTLVAEAAFSFLLGDDPQFESLTDEERTALQGRFFELVEEMAGAGDVYGFRAYPVAVTEPPVLETVEQFVDQARSLEAAARPLAVLQGFGHDDAGERPGRRPTTVETRFMAFTAVMHGARALVWAGTDALSEDAPLWTDILATAEELRGLAPIFDLPVIDLPPQTSRVEARGFIDGDVVWMIAANPTDGEQRLTVPMVRPGGPPHVTLRDVTTGEVLATGGDAPWTETMAGRAVRVMSITACE